MRCITVLDKLVPLYGLIYSESKVISKLYSVPISAFGKVTSNVVSDSPAAKETDSGITKILSELDSTFTGTVTAASDLSRPTVRVIDVIAGSSS